MSSFDDLPPDQDALHIEMESISNQAVPQKMDLMLLTNGWNDKNERIVISIGENAASYKWMHEKSAIHYALYHRVFGILLIVFSTALSAESILPTDYNLALFIIRRVLRTLSQSCKLAGCPKLAILAPRTYPIRRSNLPFPAPGKQQGFQGKRCEHTAVTMPL